MKSLLAPLLILAACSCETPPEQPSEIVTAGTSQPEGQKFRTPLRVDSAFFCSLKGGDSLSFREVRAMTGSIAEVGDHRVVKGILNDFCRIDSIKHKGSYQSFLDTLGLGMTQDAFAEHVGIVTLPGGTPIRLWRLMFSSYEACPVFTGTCLIGSVWHGKNVSHVVLGKLANWTDPPSSMTELMTSNIEDSWISITLNSVFDDFDTPRLEENTTTCYTVRITESGTSTEKEKEVTAQASP